MMSLFWPPSWFKKKPRPAVPAPTHNHRAIAAEFFMMPYKEQRQVLFHLGVSWENQTVILDDPYIFKDVQTLLATMQANEEGSDCYTDSEYLDAATYLDRLKAIHLSGRGYHVAAAFQNIFRDMKEAEHYSNKVLEWG